jgi:hypothetical protein
MDNGGPLEGRVGTGHSEEYSRPIAIKRFVHWRSELRQINVSEMIYIGRKVRKR